MQRTVWETSGLHLYQIVVYRVMQAICQVPG